MLCQSENFQISESCPIMDIAVLTVIGDREDQQDCCGYTLGRDSGLIVLCDGMGGHLGGALASSTAVSHFVSSYEVKSPTESDIVFLSRTALEANERIRSISDANGVPLHAGSTVVALLIKNNRLYWCSVGDSRAYLFRKGEFVQFTLDHNYKTVLDERLRAGEIDEAEYDKEMESGEALISFLGIDDLKLIDYNNEPLYLQKDDKIIVMSDGLYKLVPDSELATLLDNFSNISDALRALDMKAKKKARTHMVRRDNMTAIVIKVNYTEE